MTLIKWLLALYFQGPMKSLKIKHQKSAEKVKEP